jgi:hypothetical protein
MSVLLISQAMKGINPEPVREQQTRVDGSRVARTLVDITPEPAPERLLLV